MKTCRKCTNTLPFENFNKCKKEKDGHQYYCRECQSTYRIEYGRCNSEKINSACRKWKRNNPIVASRSRTKWKKDNPEKVRAQKCLQEAVKHGRIIRQRCETCGISERVQGHHEDYSKPLDVMWLCPLCHQKRHRGIRGIG